jgi:hypothetical protein
MTLQALQDAFSSEKRLCKLCKTHFQAKNDFADFARGVFERKMTLQNIQDNNSLKNDKYYGKLSSTQLQVPPEERAALRLHPSVHYGTDGSGIHGCKNRGQAGRTGDGLRCG